MPTPKPKKPGLVKFERADRVRPAASPSQFVGLCPVKPLGCIAVSVTICRGCFLSDPSRYVVPPNATDEHRQRAMWRKHHTALAFWMFTELFGNPKIIQWLIEQRRFDADAVELVHRLLTRHASNFQATLRVTKAFQPPLGVTPVTKNELPGK